MRTITLRYTGECRKCGKTLPEGTEAGYERRIGVFCPECMPTDAEEIREYRQEARDRKAEKYEGWAAKRREKAAGLHKQNEPFTSDYAFNTQPGTFPLRRRVNKRQEVAFKHSTVASGMESKAKNLRRRPRVKGDADAYWEAKREAVRQWIKPGMEIQSGIYGHGVVVKVNRKTARIGKTGASGTYNTLVDLAFIGKELKPAKA